MALARHPKPSFQLVLRLYYPVRLTGAPPEGPVPRAV